MSHKRRWWAKDELVKGVAERLRKNYENQLKIEQRKFDDACAKLGRAHLAEEAATRQSYRELFIEERRKTDSILREITNVRLEFGPYQYSQRFEMRVQFADNFMRYATNLKEIGPYIIDRLTDQIKREFGNIDFGRAQPVTPKHWRDEPTYRIEAP